MNYDKSSLADDLRRHIHVTHSQSTDVDQAKILRALDIAFEAHEGQFRERGDQRNADIPYIAHPVGVAKLCLDMWSPGVLDDDLTTVVIVALLHDVLEDTSVEFTQIEQAFGKRVAILCEALTKPTYDESFTRSERNELAAKKILAAGSTAIFIKACDALHNISRPSAMPTGLLVKTVDKISGPYLRLLTGQRFEAAFAERFALSLSKARSLIARTQSPDEKSYSDLESFLSDIKSRTHSKVFEEHDIATIFLTVEGIEGSYIGFLEQVSANFDIKKNELSQKQLQELKRTGQTLLPKGVFNSSQESVRDSILFSVPLFNPILSNDQRSLILIGDEDRLPDWLSFNVISFALSVLTERMLGRIRDRSLELASLINFHSLDLNAKKAVDLGITTADILDLVELNHFADLTIETLRLVFRSNDLMPESSMGVESMSCRRKSPESAFKKKVARSHRALSEIDDFVGFRYVFISSIERDEFSKKLSQVLKLHSDSHARLKLSSKEEFIPRHVSSQSGYSSTHISFVAESSEREDMQVGCEIQMRTISEDAVARITHELTYKQTALSKSAKRAFDKEISVLREKLDRLVSTIYSERPK